MANEVRFGRLDPDDIIQTAFFDGRGHMAAHSDGTTHPIIGTVDLTDLRPVIRAVATYVNRIIEDAERKLNDLIKASENPEILENAGSMLITKAEAIIKKQRDGG